MLTTAYGRQEEGYQHSSNIIYSAIESVGHLLFKSFGVKSVYFFLSNVLPVYATGIDTALVVDMSF